MFSDIIMINLVQVITERKISNSFHECEKIGCKCLVVTEENKSNQDINEHSCCKTLEARENYRKW
jgi:hypothetical protein